MAETGPRLLTLLLGTVLLRPYVWVFLAVYLGASTLQFGFKRTVAFMVGGYWLVFLAEYSSTRTGFPGCRSLCVDAGDGASLDAGGTAV
jgi:hypothetical protein